MVGGVITAVSALHLAGVIALDLTAFAVLACALHVRAAHSGTIARRERLRFALGAAAVLATGVLGGDLAVIAVVDLALLGAVCAPSLTAHTSR
jgi:hypothetical protein